MPSHIQIGDVSPRIQYAADGVQTAFTYPFPIFADADVEVYLGAAKQAGGYAVSGAGSSTGGAVTFAAAPASGAIVTLRRYVTLARTTDFQEGGALRAKALNDELDYQVAAMQHLEEELGRSVKRSVTDETAADLTLPAPAADLVLAWNATGDGLTNGPSVTAIADALPNAQAAAASATAAASSATSAAGSANSAAASATAAQTAAASNLYSTVTDKTASFAVLATDDGTMFRLDASGGALTVTLPAVADAGDGFRVAFARLDASANVVTVQRAGTDAIEGGTSFTLPNQYDSATVIADTATSQWTAIVNPDDATLLRKDQSAALAAGFGLVKGTLTDGATVTPDFAVANAFDWTLVADRTLAFPTIITGQTAGCLYIDATASGAARTVTLGSGLTLQAGSLAIASGATARLWVVLKSATVGHVYAEVLA